MTSSILLFALAKHIAIVGEKRLTKGAGDGRRRRPTSPMLPLLVVLALGRIAVRRTSSGAMELRVPAGTAVAAAIRGGLVVVNHGVNRDPKLATTAAIEPVMNKGDRASVLA